jgi:photosystem II stability/assembly factor-like uncharacterized protein
LAFTSFTTGWVEVIRSPSQGVGLYSTIDAGRNWKPVATPGPDPDRFFDLQVLDNRHLLATTDLPDGLWISDDGGKTWAKRSPSALSPQASVHRSRWGQFFLDARHGWVLDSPSNPAEGNVPSVLWATSDGGVTWNEAGRLDPRSPEFGGVLRQGVGVDLSFRDTTTGFLGLRFIHETMLYRTDDGGRTWRPVVLPLEHLGALNFQITQTRDGAVIVFSSNGSVTMSIASRDGGDHWEAPNQLPESLGGFRRIGFLDHDHWRSISLHGGLVLVTNDAGKTWASFSPSVPPQHLLEDAMWFGDRLHAWGRAANLLLRSEDGGHAWSSAGPP